jgi:predicted membrane chloride channel (bestrophin family)
LNALKTKLQAEGSELSHKLGQLKLQPEDGKFYNTDVADTEQLLRLIQSIPSPKAEPFKQWLAKTGYERIEEIQDPEKSIDRAMGNYLKQKWCISCFHKPAFASSYLMTVGLVYPQAWCQHP